MRILNNLVAKHNVDNLKYALRNTAVNELVSLL